MSDAVSALVQAVFAAAPVWPQNEPAYYATVIDYAALSEVMIYQGEALDVDHSMLAMEDWMWARYQDRLARWYATGVWA